MNTMKEMLSACRGGLFVGTNLLWLEGAAAPALESPARAELEVLAPGKLIRCSYTWTFEGQTQHGSMVVAWNTRAERASAGWVDSFHQSSHVMQLEGVLEDGGAVAVSGSYPAPSGPDWGWRIRLESPTADELLVLMDNVSPDGLAEPAVRIDLRRQT
jgi:hypothetical protein